MWTQRQLQSLFAHLAIHPPLPFTESLKNLLCAKHCPRCLGYDSEQNKLSPLIELSSGYRKIKHQVAQIMMSATETIRLRGTLSDEVTVEQRLGVNEGCEPCGNLGKQCCSHRAQQVKGPEVGASLVWGRRGGRCGWREEPGDSGRRRCPAVRGRRS